ncbi:MAG: AAA family ATPase [Nitrosomonadales bacterium]|nr:AAA family ATPase [Nitrosomonadales bacterium]
MSTQGKLTLRNYRCFDWNNPAVLEFGDGFTAFVGPNNSGKSTALRAVYELRNLFSNLISYAQNQSFSPQGITDIAELSNDSDPTRFQCEIEITDYQHPRNHTYNVATAVTLECRNNGSVSIVKTKALTPTGEVIQMEGSPQGTIVGLGNEGNGWQYQNQTAIALSPLINFAIELSQSKYFPAFRNAINEGAGNYYDLPVGTALVATWDSWKAGSLRSQKLAISRVENEIAELLGFKTLQINADQTGKTLDVIIDGRPQKLYEVGAGVAQLIIVLAAALVYKPPYILIDEPELSLHPALQLNFLATLGSYTTKGLLYSTHSISLARSTAQRIYAVKKIKNGSSRMHPFGDNAINFGSWLGELSYSSRVELGCEGLLLVEGPTDVLFFQEFLRKINKDHKYVLMQLGGSSLINAGVAQHLSELNRIIEPSKIRVFIDSEKASADAPLAEDRVAFVDECNKIGIQVQVSERRATENYFERNGIQKALMSTEYEPLEYYQTRIQF